MAYERTGPLTLAQREWFADVGADEHRPWAYAANLVAVLVPERRHPRDVVLAAIRDVLVRHEGLRTVMPWIGGERVQAVCPIDAWRDTVDLVPDDATMDAARATCFRLDVQWPIRFVVFGAGDEVTRIGVVIDHAAMDGWSMRLIDRDLTAALAARAAGRDPYADAPAVEQPVDTALAEAGPAGQRAAARSERFWRDRFETLRDGLGDWTPPAVPVPDAPMLTSVRLVSGAAARSAETVAAATGTRPATVYLLAFATAIAAVEGAPVVGLRSLSANRLTSGAQASIRKAVMPAPVVARVGGDFRADLADVAVQQLDGARHANVDPARIAAMADELLGARRSCGATAARFNFVDNAMIAIGPDDVILSRERIAFTDPAHQDVVEIDPPRLGGSRYILSIEHHPRGAVLTLACHDDTLWSPVAVDMLRHVESVMVAAAKLDSVKT